MAAKTKGPARYFIINPAGAIHEVTREHAQERLAQPGYRKATKADVDRLLAAGGNQRAGEPLVEPWSTEPDAIELDE